MESVKVNVTFCKIVGNLQSGNNVDDDAPFCEYSRRCHDHKSGQRVSSDPSNDQTATLTAWIRRDGRRTRWNVFPLERHCRRQPARHRRVRHR